jgi:TRAP transporter TAXI family solute receptor
MVVLLVFAPGCSDDTNKRSDSDESINGRQKQYLAFGGGPTGGTFNFFANKMANLISARYEWIDVSTRGSGGSVENLRTLNKNGIDMGIVYSGDAFIGRTGKLLGDSTRYNQVAAIAYLYGAPAQLVVRQGSGIDSIESLEGKNIAIGNPGSGAALSAERFFKHLKMWRRIEHRNLGYSQAAADFIAGKIDAFWVLVGYPNSSIIEAASQVPIKLLDLGQIARASGLYGVYPFYSEVDIPANTYKGQTEVVHTFQDAALWCASRKLNEVTVYDSLQAVFVDEGLKSMVSTHKAAWEMSIQNGLKGVSVPLHDGALRFWKEQGVTIPSNVTP